MDTSDGVQQHSWEALYGPNVGYALELYERYLHDPGSVDEATRAVFERIRAAGDDEAAVATLARPSTTTSQNGVHPAPPAASGSASGSPEPTAHGAHGAQVLQIVAAARLARGIREYGHLDAAIDPLNGPRPGDPMLDPTTHHITDADLARLPASIVWPSAGPESGSCLDAVKLLREIYCGPIGYEFDHVQDFNERAWLHQMVESGQFRRPLSPEQRSSLLYRLSEVEGFERFLHTVFQGQKRFSLEGTDMLVPMLDEVIRSSGQAGTREILIGMAHRGRLNVLAHILCKPYAAILAQFQHAAASEQAEDTDASSGSGTGWTGDVKYHLGAFRTVDAGSEAEMHVTLADNPSHLEVVNPVIEGFARAAQDRRCEPGPPSQDIDAALCITIHGDAAFPGEGVVAETLNLSRLPGYQTGGTIRIIVNNQVGFTTTSGDARSTLYASDLAKGFEIPIVHVNADDPEACLAVVRMADAYRQRFHKDFLVDLVGYRRWGHNEGDEPSFTQPRLYAQITGHPTVRARYAEQLVAEGAITPDDVQRMVDEVQDALRQARDAGAPGHSAPPAEPHTANHAPQVDHSVTAEKLRALNDALLERPDGFTANPKLDRVLQRRREALGRDGAIDWAHAETLALASILADGTPIRLTGQDTERGTFSQRHLVLHDPESGAQVIPLQRLPQARASFAVYNSPLTEAAVLGFEYGYSVHAPEALVLWEAQFGDFANTGQVLIDQFIASARAKWRQSPALVLLLPHGYEGQGPEHSSARLERYLQLAAQENLRIANCTTSAQYFHLLRLQAGWLRSDRRPLVIMSPKSLLRHPRAGSSLADLTEGSFQPILRDPSPGNNEAVTRLILCAGKVAIDLLTSEQWRSEPLEWASIARVEMLYPFPSDEIERLVGEYPNLEELVWLQEEPMNMGAWSFLQPRLQAILPAGVRLRYIGRSERASTAEGSSDDHTAEQSRIIHDAFDGQREARIETRGVQYVD